MANTGYKIKKYLDTNPYSPTYGEVRTEKIYAPDECPDDRPVWSEISRVCNKINYQPSGAQGNDGKATIIYEDINIDSPSFGQTKTEISADLTNCPLPNKTPDWELQSSTCEVE